MEKKAYLICPHCQSQLKPVTIPNKYGQAVIVDQCINCGGIWFDEWELFPLQAKEIEKLESFSQINLQQLKKEHIGNNLCPKCSTGLAILKDPIIPKSIEMMQCAKCSGFWLNQGEALEYKKWQEEKKKKNYLNDQISSSAEKLLEQHKDSYDAIGQIGNILSTPVYGSGRHLYTMPSGFSLNENEKKAQKIANIAVTVLQVIFQALFRI